MTKSQQRRPVWQLSRVITTIEQIKPYRATKVNVKRETWLLGMQTTWSHSSPSSVLRLHKKRRMESGFWFHLVIDLGLCELKKILIVLSRYGVLLLYPVDNLSLISHVLLSMMTIFHWEHSRFWCLLVTKWMSYAFIFDSFLRGCQMVMVTGVFKARTTPPSVNSALSRSLLVAVVFQIN